MQGDQAPEVEAGPGGAGVDVDQIMAEIRETIRRQAEAAERARPPAGPDLARLRASYDIYHAPITSHRRLLGRAIVAGKRWLRRLLSPVLQQQVAFNAAATAAIEDLHRALAAEAARTAQLRDEVRRLREALGGETAVNEE
jgi:hypothetical protein